MPPSEVFHKRAPHEQATVADILRSYFGRHIRKLKSGETITEEEVILLMKWRMNTYRWHGDKFLAAFIKAGADIERAFSLSKNIDRHKIRGILLEALSKRNETKEEREIPKVVLEGVTEPMILERDKNTEANS